MPSLIKGAFKAQASALTLRLYSSYALTSSKSMETNTYVCSLRRKLVSICTNALGNLAPLEEIEPHIRRLWKVRLTDKEIVAELRKCIDTTQYGIG